MLVKSPAKCYVLLRDNGRFTNSYTFQPTETGGVRIKFVCGMDHTRDYDGVTDIEDARNLWRYLRTKGYEQW